MISSSLHLIYDTFFTCFIKSERLKTKSLQAIKNKKNTLRMIA